MEAFHAGINDCTAAARGPGKQQEKVWIDRVRKIDVGFHDFAARCIFESAMLTVWIQIPSRVPNVDGFWVARVDVTSR